MTCARRGATSALLPLPECQANCKPGLESRVPGRTDSKANLYDCMQNYEEFWSKSVPTMRTGLGGFQSAFALVGEGEENLAKNPKEMCGFCVSQLVSHPAAL